MFLRREGFDGKYPLDNGKDKFIIGRSPQCDFHFASPYVSRMHCEIMRLKPMGTLIIRNLKESNITYVGDYQLQNTDCVELRSGATIGLGVPLAEERSNSKFVFLQLCRESEEFGAASSTTDALSNPVASSRVTDVRSPGDRVAPSTSAASQNNGSPAQVEDEVASSLHESTLERIQHRKARSRRSLSVEKPETSSLCGQSSHDIHDLEAEIVILNAESPKPLPLQKQNAQLQRDSSVSNPSEEQCRNRNSDRNEVQAEVFHRRVGNLDGKYLSHTEETLMTQSRSHLLGQHQVGGVNLGEKMSAKGHSGNDAHQTRDESTTSVLQTYSPQLSNKMKLKSNPANLGSQGSLKSPSLEKASSSKQNQAGNENLPGNFGNSCIGKFTEVMMTDTDDQYSSDCTEGSVKTTRGSFGFTPFVTAAVEDCKKQQSSNFRKTKQTHNLSTSGECVTRHAYHDDLGVIDEDMPTESRKVLRKKIEPDSSEVPVTTQSGMKQCDISLRSKEKNSVVDIESGAALSPSSIDLTQPDPKDENSVRSEDDGEHNAEDSEEDVSDFFLEDDKKEIGKRKRSDVDHALPQDISEEMEREGKKAKTEQKNKISKITGSNSKQPDSSSRNEDESRPLTSMKLSKKANKLSPENPLQHDWNVTKIKENKLVISRKSKGVRHVLDSDSDNEDSVLGVRNKAKRKRTNRVNTSDSESKSSCITNDAPRTGLRSIEESLVSKKCVVPVPRVSPDIVKGSDEGKRIIVTNADKVKVVPTVEATSKITRSTDKSKTSKEAPVITSRDTDGKNKISKEPLVRSVRETNDKDKPFRISQDKTREVDYKGKTLTQTPPKISGVTDVKGKLSIGACNGIKTSEEVRDEDESDDDFFFDDDDELPDLSLPLSLSKSTEKRSDVPKGKKVDETAKDQDEEPLTLPKRYPEDSDKTGLKTDKISKASQRKTKNSDKSGSSKSKGDSIEEVSKRSRPIERTSSKENSEKNFDKKEGNSSKDARLLQKSATDKNASKSDKDSKLRSKFVDLFEETTQTSMAPFASTSSVSLPKHDKKTKQTCTISGGISDMTMGKSSTGDGDIQKKIKTEPNTTDIPKPQILAPKETKNDDITQVKIKVEKDDAEDAGKGDQSFKPTVIKKEPVDDGYVDTKKTTTEGVGNDDEEDDDEVVVVYSQMDDTIWVSSDEEELPLSQENASFGPLPPSPDLGIAKLFEENNSDSGIEEPKRSSLDLGSKAHVEEEDDDDDQWFPVLSQAFWADDDELPKPIKDTSKKDEKQQEKDAVAGPSKKTTASGANTSSSDWWPELSQNFFDDDDDEDDNIFTSGTSSKNVEPSKADDKHLDNVIERLKNRDVRKAQLIDPKVPLPRTKNDTLRKRGRTNSYEDKSEKSIATAPPEREKESKESRKSAEEVTAKSKSRTPTKSRRRERKSSGLRKDLKKKYNLASYQAIAKHHPKEGQSKESTSSKEREIKRSEQPKGQSHLISDKPRKGENISIQKKIQQSPNEESARTKVAAKITRKTRSEKLTEVNLFPSPQLPAPKTKKQSYKIPKKHSAPEKKGESSHQSKGLAPETNSVKSSNLSHISSDGGHSPLSSPVAQSVISFSKPQSDQSSGQSDSNTISKDKAQLDSGDSPQISSMQEDENKENHENLCSRKSILKMDGISKQVKKKKVRFPAKAEDLTKILYISPRKDSEKRGPLAPKVKEVLPKEVIFGKHNIPVNYPDYFIVEICRWNYDWLETYREFQQKLESSGKQRLAKPPVVKTVSYPTLVLYDSYRDYKEIFTDLFYLEVWENIYRDWLKYRHNNAWFPCYVDKVDDAFIQRRHESPLKSWKMKLVTLITSAQSNSGSHPAQGSLISIKISRESEKKRSHHLFGYVLDVGKQKKRMVPKELEKAQPLGEVTLLLEVRIAKDPGIELKSSTVISVVNISYIRPFTRTWDGLCKLPLSPLCNDILNPKQECFMDNHCAKYLVPEMPLNDCQTKAVTRVSGKCVFDQHVPKMSLIHGPPGTGKTRTIVSLVAQIVRLSNEERLPNCRILLCAPSNAVADELTLRLVRLREIKLSLRIVRVGIRNSISEEVRPFTLESFVAKHMTRELKTPRNNSARKEWERRKNVVKVAGEDVAKAKREGKPKDTVKALDNRLNELMKSLSDFEKSVAPNLSFSEYQKLQQQWQREYLLGAQVIITTLGGSLSGPMADVFSDVDHPFTCCIVDEAGQCKETEIWLPLLYGVRKLVLVGDHRQLPATVISQLAQNKNLKQSLFERLYHRFVVELQKDDLVHTLNIQYRMHPEIADWPSQHFYFSKLKTCPEIVEQRSYDCKPYAIFDLKNSLEQRGLNNEIYNPVEVQVVRLILESLEQLISKLKIGIITPYQCQKGLLERELSIFQKRLSININTIDGFQGQERDIIILSFVRANAAAQIGFLSQSQRLNVALTRARKSCFIVASLSSLSKNTDWQSLIADAKARKVVHEVHESEMKKDFFKSVLAR